MARRRKDTVQEIGVINLNVPVGSDLPLRLKKISTQTGLSPSDLFQKWILQEEFTIGLMSYGEKTVGAGKAEKNEAPVTRKGRRKGSPEQAPKQAGKKDSGYRDTLVERVKKLKSEGWTLKKIADTFNDENVPTVSGTGKWYTSSITWLLKSGE